MKGVPSQLAPLLATTELPDLGPGPRKGVRPISEIERGMEAVSAGISECNRELVLGTILLWHDHLDAAHEIAQEIETPDGSYLHAIMHRREPDYSNAKYWFRRVGGHSCYPALAKHVAEKVLPVQPELARRLAPRGEWDAFAFVDACETASSKSPGASNLLREIQGAEFRTFLNYLLPTADAAAG